MRVLVTGALGFVGSHLTDALLARGDEVFGIDDMSANVVDKMPSEALGFWKTDARSLEGAALKGFDLVVHAASPVGPVALLERQSIVSEIIETTQAAIRYCETNRVPLINISTSEVYGFSGVYRETDACVTPHKLTHRIQYAAGKLAAEHLVRTSNILAVSIRPFNVAGPRQTSDKGFVLPTFVEQAIQGKPLTIFDGGIQERCLTAVWDVVDFILHLADGAALKNDVFNVGNPNNRITVTELAKMVKMMVGSRSHLLYTTGKEVHGPAYEEAVGVVKVPNIARAVSTGWSPKVPLEELVDRTAAEIRAKELRMVA